MKWSMRLLQPLIVVAFSFSLLIMVISPKTIQGFNSTRARGGKKGVDLDPDQSFSGVAGSTIEYNVYIKNKGSSMANYTLTALSNQGYYVEVWRDNDQLGGGDIQLIPPQGSIITLEADEVATLIVKVTVPSNATDGTVDATTIEAVSTDLDTSDSVTVMTTINSGLPHPSNWIQLGSDPVFPSEEQRPDAKAFLYNVYLDTKAGGQQIGSDYYDYMLSSDGILYEWNGTNWINSGYPTYFRVDGTSIVLWTDLDNLSLDTQNINVLAHTTTKDRAIKDEEGPYVILRNNISEITLILIPLVTLAIYLAVSSRRKKRLALV